MEIASRTPITGVGQSIRRYGLRKISWELLWSHWAAFKSHAIVLLASVLLLSLLVAGQMLLFAVGVALLVTMLLVLIFVRGRKRVYLFFRFAFFVIVNLLQGICPGILSSDEYRVRTSVLSRAGRA